MNAKETSPAGPKPIDWCGMFFDGSMRFLFVLTLILGAAVWYFHGAGAVLESLTSDALLLLSFTPKMALGYIIAAFVTALVSRALISQWLGESAGARGVSVATGLGLITPGGPMIAFPLVAALSAAGSGRAALIAYVTSWEVLGFQRVLIWEMQFLGVEMMTIRWLVSVPLPFLAALVSYWLPRAPPAPELNNEEAQP